MRGRRLAAATGIVLGCLSLALLAWALAGGSWLNTGEPPRPADLLVILDGGALERLQTGLDLYRAGLSPAILLTGEREAREAQTRWLRDRGVPETAFEPSMLDSSSTHEDALAIREVIANKRVKSLLIVTSPYHCRRARLILGRTLSDLGVQLTVTASLSLYWDLDNWWSDRQGWVTIPVEYAKLVVAWANVPTAASDASPSGRRTTGTP